MIGTGRCVTLLMVGGVLGGVLAVAGCGDGASTPRATGSGGTATSASPAASVAPEVAAFEKFSGLTIPAGATGVAVTRKDDAAGNPLYRAVFSMPSGQTNSFCAAGGMGGQLRTSSVPASLRTVFDYRGSSTALAICQASLPADVDVQRRVLVVGTDQPDATVHVVAFRQGR